MLQVDTVFVHLNAKTLTSSLLQHLIKHTVYLNYQKQKYTMAPRIDQNVF